VDTGGGGIDPLFIVLAVLINVAVIAGVLFSRHRAALTIN